MSNPIPRDKTPGMKRRLIRLKDEQITTAREIGDGNLSMGIRAALDYAATIKRDVILKPTTGEQ